MKVKIKTWEQMRKEFGEQKLVNGTSCIDCRYYFGEQMEKEMSKDRIIKVVDGKWNGWSISEDMIEYKIKKPRKNKRIKKSEKLRKQLNETIEELHTNKQIELLQTIEIDNLKKTIKEYVDLIQDLRTTKQGLEEYIESQEKHLSIAEKAIERKDKQFYGLRAAYQDEIINKD